MSLCQQRNETGGVSALIEDTDALTSIQQAADLKRKEKLFLKHVGDAGDIPVAKKEGRSV